MTSPRIRPKRILGIRKSGKIAKLEKKEFTIKIPKKDSNLGFELLNFKDERYNLFDSRQLTENSQVYLFFLNPESAKGLYQDKENNLPYEIKNYQEKTIYRQSIIEKKEDIFNKLEKLATEEGLRN